MSRDGKNRGAAMVIVLCVMAVFLALSATVLLSGSVALNTARTNIILERAKAQAVSLSNAFVKDMLAPSKEGNAYLAQYVRDEITGGWTAYDETADNRGEAVRMFSMDDESTGEQHQIRIEIYWTGSRPDPDRPEEYQDAAEKVRLFIDVVSTLNQSEYRVPSEFELENIVKNEDGYDSGEESAKGNYAWEWQWKAVGREN